jgi:FlaA1/EpsC-like NDP-sugar epimerase
LSIIHYFLPFYFDVNVTGFPRSIPVYYWLELTLLIALSRMAARWLILCGTSNGERKQAVVIYGAGSAGMQLAASLAQNNETQVLGFIDDDERLKKHWIQNFRVLGTRSAIVKMRKKHGGLTVLLAMPTISQADKKSILNYLEDKAVNVRTLPSMDDLVSGRFKVSDLLAVDIDDLLGRESVAPNAALLAAAITDKNVLVTGAGGSIGSELCRQILSLKPKTLVLFDHSEYNLYQIDKELERHCAEIDCGVDIKAILGSVVNEARVSDVLAAFNIHTIYHGAAYKHVPLVEYNVCEGVNTNFFGTYFVAKAALAFNVENFVLVSTDKAVRPTNVMGASKRMAELVVQGLAQHAVENNPESRPKTHFTMVRFGNVLGSSGSVIPLFQKQIESGGPVTVTHPDITRFFMTIPEAAELVIQAGSMGLGGDVFVLDMGEPVKINDLAKKMIHLSGYVVEGADTNTNTITIDYTGLRDGEKLYEELLIGDNVQGTAHPKIMTADEVSYPWPEMERILKQFQMALAQRNSHKVRELLKQYVSGFIPQCANEDLMGEPVKRPQKQL